MQIKIDLKSLVLGAVLGAFVVFTMAAATSQSSSCGGRYQLVTTENYIFKIDSETGQTWYTYASNPSKAFLVAPMQLDKAAAPQAEKPVDK